MVLIRVYVMAFLCTLFIMFLYINVLAMTFMCTGWTYFCGACDKVFSRADNRNRHEAAHRYGLTCGVCGQYFNRMDNLARHRAPHEKPEAKQRLPMKRPAAPESGPSPKQRSTVLPPRTPMENPVGPDVLPEDPDTRELRRQHWQSIRTEGRPATLSRSGTTLHSMRWQRPPLQRWYCTCTDSRPQPSRSTCLLVLSSGTSRLECCCITILARTTPDCLMFHTSSEQKKTWRGLKFNRRLLLLNTNFWQVPLVEQ